MLSVDHTTRFIHLDCVERRATMSESEFAPPSTQMSTRSVNASVTGLLIRERTTRMCISIQR